jgi:cytochrome c peroxidase
MKVISFSPLVWALLCVAALAACASPVGSSLTGAEEKALASLSLGDLPPLPESPSNAVADDQDAANLGHALFFDTRLSRNGEVSCATCHNPRQGFTDGLARSRGIGVMTRKTMSPVGAAYSPWLFWDGRKDSLWAQALGPLEAEVEHGFTRGEVAQVIAAFYTEDYAGVFGSPPDLDGLPEHAGPNGDRAAQAAWRAMSANERDTVTRVFVNVGKAIEAFERTLTPEASRFDAYAEAVLRGNPAAREMLTAEEIAGFKLFVGEAGCVTCHSGPRLTDDAFHNTGVPVVPGLPEDVGRVAGVQLLLTDEFNCLSAYSDAEPSECTALQGLETDDASERAYKVPSLRDVASRPPYMHAGQFRTLREVLAHYNRAPAALSGKTELEPLGLSEIELERLEAFLKTLDSESGVTAR